MKRCPHRLPDHLGSGQCKREEHTAGACVWTGVLDCGGNVQITWGPNVFARPVPFDSDWAEDPDFIRVEGGFVMKTVEHVDSGPAEEFVDNEAPWPEQSICPKCNNVDGWDGVCCDACGYGYAGGKVPE